MGGKGSGRPRGTRKKDHVSGAPGTKGTAQAWDDAAKKADESTATEQTRLPISAEDVSITREERELANPMSHVELEQVGADLARKQVRIAELGGEIDLYTKPRKAEIKQLAKESKKLAKEVDAKARFTMIECRVENDFRVNTVRVYRLDRGDPKVGELIEQRAMKADERLRAVFDPPSPDVPRVEVPAEPAKAKHESTAEAPLIDDDEDLDDEPEPPRVH